MAYPKILLEQILCEVIKDLILSSQSVCRRNAAHTGHLMHVDQRPAACEPCAVLAIDEHHAWHNADVMLPTMTKLMPPFAFYDLGLVDLVDGPEVFVVFVEEDGLEDVLVVGYGRFVCVMVHAELMLVVGAVERHLYFLHVFWVGVGVVHWSVTTWLAILTLLFVFGEGNLLLLLLVLWFGAEFGVEVGLVVFREVFAVGVGDGDVVEEMGATEDELLTPGGGLTK